MRTSFGIIENVFGCCCSCCYCCQQRCEHPIMHYVTNFKNTKQQKEVMPLSGMLTCGSCGARTQMNSMRYNLSGSKLICQSCVEKERSSIKPGTTQAASMRLQREQMQRDVNEKTGRSEAAESLRPGETRPAAGSNGM